METQDDLDLGTAPDDLQQGQSDATLLKQVCWAALFCFLKHPGARKGFLLHEQAMINEKVAPELLEYDAPLVASIEAQLEHQVSAALGTAMCACICTYLSLHHSAMRLSHGQQFLRVSFLLSGKTSALHPGRSDCRLPRQCGNGAATAHVQL